MGARSAGSFRHHRGAGEGSEASRRGGRDMIHEHRAPGAWTWMGQYRRRVVRGAGPRRFGVHEGIGLPEAEPRLGPPALQPQASSPAPQPCHLRGRQPL